MADEHYEEVDRRARAEYWAGRGAGAPGSPPAVDHHRQRAEKLRADEARHRADVEQQAKAGRLHMAALHEQMADEAAARAAIHERHVGIEPVGRWTCC